MSGILTDPQIRLLADALRGTSHEIADVGFNLFGFVPDVSDAAVRIQIDHDLERCPSCRTWLDSEQFPTFDPSLACFDCTEDDDEEFDDLESVD